MRKFPLPTIITAGALVLILVLYAVTYQVRFSDKVLRVRLGKADAGSIESEPGIKPRWPWPIEQVARYDKRLRVLDTPEAETKTRDGQNIVVGCYALWRIEDTLKFYQVVRDEAKAEAQLRARINEVRQTVVGTVDISAFVNLDEAKVRYDEIEQAMLDACADTIKRDYGIQLEAIGIRRISLPERATAKVFESMSAARATIAGRLQYEGSAAAQAIQARAQADADKIMSFAQRRAQEIRSEGTQASFKVFEQIEKEDRELYLFLKRMDSLATIFQQGTTFFLDTKTELFRIFAEQPVSGNE